MKSDNVSVKIPYDDAITLLGDVINVGKDEDYFLFDNGILEDAEGNVLLGNVPKIYFKELMEKNEI